jgi:hypothetical protein
MNGAVVPRGTRRGSPWCTGRETLARTRGTLRRRSSIYAFGVAREAGRHELEDRELVKHGRRERTSPGPNVTNGRGQEVPSQGAQPNAKCTGEPLLVACFEGMTTAAVVPTTRLPFRVYQRARLAASTRRPEASLDDGSMSAFHPHPRH